MEYDLHHGDCLQVLASLDDNSVDAVVTDPPYGIGFMGKEWDSFSPETTGKIRAKDVEKDTDNPNLKGRKSPSFGAAVHYDKGADANYRYQMWTHRWAEAIKRVLKPGGHMLVCMGSRTAHRVTCGIEDAGFEIRHVMPWLFWLYGKGMPKSKWLDADKTIGTGLKPMYEPILMARKPCGGIATACYVEHGTGGLNIDACRVDGGRWAPDVMLDEDAAAMLDEATGHLQAGQFSRQNETWLSLVVSSLLGVECCMIICRLSGLWMLVEPPASSTVLRPPPRSVKQAVTTSLSRQQGNSRVGARRVPLVSTTLVLVLGTGLQADVTTTRPSSLLLLCSGL